jgi:hypothetical protein
MAKKMRVTSNPAVKEAIAARRLPAAQEKNGRW